MNTNRFLPFIIFSLSAMTPILQARTWTEAGSGRTVEGEFVNRDGDEIVIKQAGGRTFKIPIARLSEADQTYLQSQSPAKPDPASSTTVSAGSGNGPLTKLVPPVSAKGLPITGEGKERKSGIEVTNNGERTIKGLVVRMYYLNADGSIGKTVPHTQSGFYGLEKGDVLKKGKTYTVDLNSFFMKDDTASIDGMVSEITFEDDSMWPALPAEPPTRNGEDSVSAVMIGVIGEGERAEPVVACHNHDSKDVKSVSYRIEYLDAAGKEIDRTSYGYAGSDPILPSGKGIAISGGDGPPEGAIDARVSVIRLEFADGSKWEESN